MKSIFAISLLAVFAGTTMCQDSDTNRPQPGHQIAQSLTTSDTSSINFLIYLPRDYGAASDKKQKSWPLMLFLHGAGERGTDIELVKKWGPPKIVQTDPSFPFVVVSPQCPLKKYWNHEHLNELLDHVIENFQIDRERVYVTGLSMGGHGTWGLAAAHPDKIAAAAPICGGGKYEMASHLTQLPIWAFHGDADEIVPVAASIRMVDSIKEKGGKLVKLTIYEGVGHNSWTETYANKELYQWMLQQRLRKSDKEKASPAKSK